MSQRFYQQLLYIFVWLVERAFSLKFQIPEVTIMIRVQDDQPDVHFKLALKAASDGEGSPIPASDFAFSDPVSDNESAVNFLNYANGEGDVHFGSPNPDGTSAVANLTSDVTEVATGKVVGTLRAQVEVSHGAPVKFEGGFEFEGLTDEP